ncbi:hypothetical protein BGZ65_008330, partial [Modicella reniformis]
FPTYEMDMDEAEKMPWVCKDLSDLRIRIRGLNTAVKIERAIRLWLAERKNKRKRKWYLEDLEMASVDSDSDDDHDVDDDDDEEEEKNKKTTNKEKKKKKKKKKKTSKKIKLDEDGDINVSFELHSPEQGDQAEDTEDADATKDDADTPKGDANPSKDDTKDDAGENNDEINPVVDENAAEDQFAITSVIAKNDTSIEARVARLLLEFEFMHTVWLGTRIYHSWEDSP